MYQESAVSPPFMCERSRARYRFKNNTDYKISLMLHSQSCLIDTFQSCDKETILLKIRRFWLFPEAFFGEILVQEDLWNVCACVMWSMQCHACAHLLWALEGLYLLPGACLCIELSPLVLGFRTHIFV
jgi:hypothetical protein